jgi:hypothetical protein
MHSNIVAEENYNSTIKVVNMDNYQTAQQLSESVYIVGIVTVITTLKRRYEHQQRHL